MQYKVIAGGYKKGQYIHESQAMHEAKKLSYHYPNVIIRRIHDNGHRVCHTDDMVVRGNTVTWA